MIKLTREHGKTRSGKSSQSFAAFQFDSSVNYDATVNGNLVIVRFDVDATEFDSYTALKVNNRSIRLNSKKQECGYKEFFIDHDATKRVNQMVTGNTKQVVIVLNTKIKFED